MKKLIISLVLALYAICASAQVYGDFDCKDPGAWFDKEIYFVAQNLCAYGIYGQNLSNVEFVVDGKYAGKIDLWQYGTMIVIDDVKLDKGSVVNMFVNGNYWGQWVCQQSQPSLTGTLYNAYRDYRIAKRILKMAKRFR